MRAVRRAAPAAPPPADAAGARREPPPRTILAVAIAGLAASIAGLVVTVGQLEWLGVLALLWAILSWALPAPQRRNAPPALLLLVWAHPLPGRLFSPLEFAAQRLSVRGSEWFLHALNVRVWADGLVLRTGMATYEVPVWCSGMRTATTVLLLALGLGLLRRFRPRLLLPFAAAAVVQAIFLNILRISSMVLFAPRLDTGAGLVFLHNTTGVLVLSAAVLVLAELLLIDRIVRHRHAVRTDLNPVWMEQLSEHPLAWRRLLAHRWLALGAAAALATVATGFYRGRPSHRTAMLKDVAATLRDSRQLESAQRLAGIVSERIPGNAAWQMEVLRLRLMRGEFERVLGDLDRMPEAAVGEAAMQRSILRAYACMGLGDMRAAAEIVAALPEHVRANDPRTAMVLAEMARVAGDVDGVVTSLPAAARWQPNLERIRALYPFLRAHREWRAIADTDARIPYDDIVTSLCAAEAAMNLNDALRVSALAADMLHRWPEDPRLVEPLFFLALQQPESEWETAFEARIDKAMRQAGDPEALYPLFAKCFALARPDLAWRLHQAIAALDPSYPGLAMNAAVHGRQWFSFRRRHVGMQTGDAHARIDLRPLYRAMDTLGVGRAITGGVPFVSELSGEDTSAARQALVQGAVEEFARRDAGSVLSLPMVYEYIAALDLLGDAAGATRRLDRLAADCPNEKDRAMLALSEIYERRGDWQRVYETLRELDASGQPALTPLLRLCRAQAYLRLGVLAVETARQALALYPSSTQALHMLAWLVNRFDSAEEAVHVLDRPRVRVDRSVGLLEAAVLHRTQRFTEAERICRTLIVPSIPIPAGSAQQPFLPPAEAVMLWSRIALPSQPEFEAQAAALRAGREDLASPFLIHLTEFWLTCYDGRAAEGSADPAAWAAGGRDDAERALLLSQLTLLALHFDIPETARRAATRAAALLPTSPLLWRMAVSLRGTDLPFIAAARRACPDDGELWLAELVATSQRARSLVATPTWETNAPALPDDLASWAVRAATDAAASNRFSAAAMARAADYFFRGGLDDAAVIASAHAASRARGLLPASIAGIRGALIAGDRRAALAFTQQAIEASISPPAVLFREYVSIRVVADPFPLDNEMVEALKRLRRDEPLNPLWAQMLGYIRFQRGGWEMLDALSQMESAVQYGATNRTPYAVGAEAARQLGRTSRAVELLREGVARFPGDLDLLNNLIYTLAQTPEGVEEALDRIDALLEAARRSVHTLDTASTVYTRAGLLDRSDRTLGEILARVEPGSRAWFRARSRSAEVELLRGKAAEAVRSLRELLNQTPRIPEGDLRETRDLLRDAEASAAEAGRTNGPATP